MAVENKVANLPTANTNAPKKPDFYVNLSFVPAAGDNISFGNDPIRLYADNPIHKQIIDALSDDPDGERLKKFIGGLTATFRSGVAAERKLGL
mgnify:CR=1 FL=1